LLSWRRQVIIRFRFARVVVDFRIRSGGSGGFRIARICDVTTGSARTSRARADARFT